MTNMSIGEARLGNFFGDAVKERSDRQIAKLLKEADEIIKENFFGRGIEYLKDSLNRPPRATNLELINTLDKFEETLPPLYIEMLGKLEKALKHNPDNKHTYNILNTLGRFQVISGEFYNATSTFDDAIELNPETPTAYAHLGHLCEKLTDYPFNNSAQEYCQRVKEHNEMAADFFEKAITLAVKHKDPDNVHQECLKRLRALTGYRQTHDAPIPDEPA